MRGTELLTDAVRRLTAAGVAQPAVDARRLLAHALALEPGRLTLALPEQVAPDAAEAFGACIARRERREPVSHITGTRLFYGRQFAVSAEVLDPRPETEMLIEAALARPFEKVLDLGTGTGCILLTLLAEMPGARGLGTDLSEEALAVARANAEALHLAVKTEFTVADWFDGLGDHYDLIVANPPYLAQDELPELEPEVREYEPHLALTDGGDGLGSYREITAGAPERLLPGGRLIMEIGPGQGREVMALAYGAGFTQVAIIRDLDGRDRVVTAQIG
ncbi:peptide chain release factor N(5)-glutamine methyltransferase [Pseudoroseicyclus tamaricis]|uniref:Release factor glutamine methyltransferase n=1 Tax=Pseudoroseicyclus tamaricis TaxID=2705421 RepID=A0A6B2JSD1_9RHOB|nr:peptide chain release factor N(5)-glutamine methyltransferase [Pseudoroseicyclus tamaricis]NDV00900.1 peptide chain release factor N(5)-glutamine methyltransferase [Pseudoroseicyclus tamaricis]